MLGAATVTGSWTGGGLLMTSFVAGTIPLPWLMQTQAARLRGRFSPVVFSRVQRGLALVSVALLTWRALASSHGSCH
jgi:sulfite exporter TauE/SafE